MQKQINSLNDLRALSAMTVVMSHIGCTAYFMGTERGAYAVSVFYIISAFLSMYTTEKQKSVTDNIKWIFKKVLRIIPLYYIFTLFTFFVAKIKPDWFNTITATIPHLVKSLIFIPYENPNGIVRPILDVTWFLVLLFWFNILFGIVKLINHKYRGTITIAILVIAFIFGKIFLKDNSIFLQYKYGIISLVFEILIYYIYNISCQKNYNLSLKSNAVFNILCYILFLGLIWIYSIIADNNLRFIAEFIPFIVVLVFLLFQEQFLQFKAINIISSASYSIYLCHEFVVKGFSRLVYNLDNLTAITFILSFICLVASVLVGILCWKFLETPLNKIIKKHVL